MELSKAIDPAALGTLWFLGLLHEMGGPMGIETIEEKSN